MVYEKTRDDDGPLIRRTAQSNTEAVCVAVCATMAMAMVLSPARRESTAALSTEAMVRTGSEIWW